MYELKMKGPNKWKKILRKKKRKQATKPNQNPKQNRKEAAMRRRFLQACKCCRNLSYPSVLSITRDSYWANPFCPGYRCSYIFMVFANGKSQTLKTVRLET